MEGIWSFINSNFFVALTTIIGGSIAFIVYYKQKRDTKKDAAKILYSEIVQAENTIQDVKSIKQNQKLLELDATKYIIGESSWSKLKYLFVNDFDPNEWEKLNAFFNQRDNFDKTVKDIANLFPKNIEYRTKSIQEELAELATEQAIEFASIDKMDIEKQDTVINKYKEIVSNFRAAYVEGNTQFMYFYTPVGTYTFIDRDLDTMDLSISISSIGQKLKKIQNTRF